MKFVRASIFLAIAMVSHQLAAQVPTAQPQPNAPAYGTNVLQLLPTYSRASYLAAFGKQAPPYDMTRPPKAWFDSTKDCSSAAAMSSYNVLKVSGNLASEGTLVISNCDASRINLQGAVTYPPYTVAPSGVLEEPGDTPVNPNYLSTLDQANALLKAFSDSSLLVSQAQMSFFSYTFPANEARRFYVIGRPNGTAENVGLLLVQEYWNGVGFPGSWNVGPDGSHNWVNAAAPPDGSTDTRPAVAPPVRALLPNEQFSSTLMGAQVVRTDFNPTPAPGSDGFTAADRATLNAIAAVLHTQPPSLPKPKVKAPKPQAADKRP